MGAFKGLKQQMEAAPALPPVVEKVMKAAAKKLPPKKAAAPKLTPQEMPPPGPPPEPITIEVPDGSQVIAPPGSEAPKWLDEFQNFQLTPLEVQLAKAKGIQLDEALKMKRAWTMEQKTLQKAQDVRRTMTEPLFPKQFVSDAGAQIRNNPLPGQKAQQEQNAALLEQIRNFEKLPANGIDWKAGAAGLDALFGTNLAASAPEKFGPKEKTLQLAGLRDKLAANYAQQSQGENALLQGLRQPPGFVQNTAGIEYSQLYRDLLEMGRDREMDTPKGKGGSGRGLKQLPAKLLHDLSTGYTGAMRDIEDLRSLVDANPGSFGPVAGLFSSINPYDQTGQAIQGKIESFLQNVGKTKEGGVLRKEDEIKYRKMLTSLFNTPETAKDKLDILERDARSDMHHTLGGYEGQYDTTSLRKLYGTAAPGKKPELPSGGAKNTAPTDILEDIRNMKRGGR